MVRIILLWGLLSLAVVGAASDKGARDLHSFSEAQVGVQYSDAAARDFLKAVLSALNVSFYERAEADGITIYWNPSSQEQEREIRNRVSQYLFIKEVCKGLPTPNPADPSKEELSCTR